MLDKTTSKVLNILNKHCKDNTYIVLDKEDIQTEFKKKKRPDEETLNEIIKYLDERGYIKLKHANNGKYCFTTLPKGKLYTENKKEQKERLKKENKRQLMFLLKITVVTSISSFLGAFFGYLAINYLINIL
ncbi:MAG: hypothetical protein ACOCRO_02750 [Halanaerobiales bacterium]